MTDIKQTIPLKPKDGEYYYCFPYTTSTCFTELMCIVLNAKNIKNFDNYLTDYLKNNKNEINKTNSNGHTALMIACANSNTLSSEECVKILLKHKAKINLRDNQGRTALYITAFHTNNRRILNTLKLLLKRKNIKIDKYDKKRYTPLMIASGHSKTNSTYETVELLM